MSAGASAGILLFRRSAGRELEVMLVHPGGPFWAKKDAHGWSIPKGQLMAGEEPLVGALREFAEETGACLVSAPAAAAAAAVIALPPVRASSGGKVIHAFAVEQDFDVTALHSNRFDLEWPPRSGRLQSFPEVDRAAWFPASEARGKLHKGQVGLIDHLLRALR